MKKLSMLIILVVLITSCATMPNRKVVYIEKTFKQNMIDIGKVILGASIIVGGYAIIQKKSTAVIMTKLKFKSRLTAMNLSYSQKLTHL